MDFDLTHTNDDYKQHQITRLESSVYDKEVQLMKLECVALYMSDMLTDIANDKTIEKEDILELIKLYHNRKS